MENPCISTEAYSDLFYLTFHEYLNNEKQSIYMRADIPLSYLQFYSYVTLSWAGFSWERRDWRDWPPDLSESVWRFWGLHPCPCRPAPTHRTGKLRHGGHWDQPTPTSPSSWSHHSETWCSMSFCWSVVRSVSVPVSTVRLPSSESRRSTTWSAPSLHTTDTVHFHWHIHTASTFWEGCWDNWLRIPCTQNILFLGGNAQNTGELAWHFWRLCRLSLFAYKDSC